MKQVIKVLMNQGLSLQQALEKIRKNNAQEDKNLKMYKIMCKYK